MVLRASHFPCHTIGQYSSRAVCVCGWRGRRRFGGNKLVSARLLPHLLSDFAHHAEQYRVLKPAISIQHG